MKRINSDMGRDMNEKTIDFETLEEGLNKIFGTPFGIIVLALNGSSNGFAQTIDQVKEYVIANGLEESKLGGVNRELEQLIKIGMVKIWSGENTRKYYLSDRGRKFANHLKDISRILRSSS